MGVRRAMEMVLAEANKGEGSIFTFGPLIHNKQVMQLLESKGVSSVEDITGFKEGTLFIRGPRHSSTSTEGAKIVRRAVHRCHLSARCSSSIHHSLPYQKGVWGRHRGGYASS